MSEECPSKENTNLCAVPLPRKTQNLSKEIYFYNNISTVYILCIWNRDSNHFQDIIFFLLYN